MVATKPKSALRTVDPRSHSSTSATIYEDKNGVVWNAMLNLTDISYGTYGNNKYYSIQLICDSGRYKVFRKWGRVGAAKPQSTMQSFSDVKEARSAFQQAFVSKSGNWWPLASGAFVKKKGKYVFVELADDEPTDTSGGGGDATMKGATTTKADPTSATTAKCSLSETVQDVVKLICDSTLIAKEVSSMNVDLKRMPLGRLSKAQISQGYALLQRLSDALTAIDTIENPSSMASASPTTGIAAATPSTTVVPPTTPLTTTTTTASGRTLRRRTAAPDARPAAPAAGATAATTAVATTAASSLAPAVTATGRATRGRAAKAKAAASAATALSPAPVSAPAPTPARTKRSKRATAADAKRVRELKTELKTLSSEFYSLIPHDFGRALPPVLDSMEAVKTKIDLLQVLADIELSQQLMQDEKAKQSGDGTTSQVHPLDAQYKMLNTEMEALDPASDEFQLIERYVARTQAPSQTAYKLKIKSVLKIARPAEQKRRSVFEQTDNHRLLWHGSRLSNVVGILSQGLRIAPPEAPKNGYMFGKGIYFADAVTKSAQYCWTSPDRPRAVLLLAEVALGKSYEAPRAEYLGFKDIDARGCASTKGVGRMAPREETFETTPDGVVVPSGDIAPQRAPAGVMFNEFIVYRPEQVKLRYLITTDFDYSSKSSGFGGSAFGAVGSFGTASSSASGPSVFGGASGSFGSSASVPVRGFGASASPSMPSSAFGTPAPSSAFSTPAPSSAFGTPAPSSAFSTPAPSSTFGTPTPFAFSTSTSPVFSTPTSSFGFGGPWWYWYSNKWHVYTVERGVWKLTPTTEVPPSGRLEVGSLAMSVPLPSPFGTCTSSGALGTR